MLRHLAFSVGLLGCSPDPGATHAAKNNPEDLAIKAAEGGFLKAGDIGVPPSMDALDAALFESNLNEFDAFFLNSPEDAEQDCFDNALAVLKPKLIDGDYEVEGTPDFTNCPLPEMMTSARVRVYGRMGCPGALSTKVPTSIEDFDFGACNGADVAYFYLSTKSTYTYDFVSEDNVAMHYRRVDYGGQMDSNGSACLLEKEDGVWHVRDNCTNFKKIVYEDVTADGQPSSLKPDYAEARSKDLFAVSLNDQYYSKGAQLFKINHWTGTMTYHDRLTAPSWVATGPNGERDQGSFIYAGLRLGLVSPMAP